MKPRLNFLVFFILVTTFFVAPPSTLGGNLKKVTFLPQWTAQAQFAGYYIAKGKGIYEKYGIDLLILPGGPDSPFHGSDQNTDERDCVLGSGAIRGFR